jgi:hypothetical protein
MTLRTLRYRVVLDLTAHIDEITDEVIHQSYDGHVDEDEAHWNWMNRQRRLLQAVLQNEQVLSEYLHYLMTYELDHRFDIDLAPTPEIKEEEDILEPVYAQMKEDEEYFRQAIRDGFFSEYIELVRESFVVDWEETQLVELSEIKRRRDLRTITISIFDPGCLGHLQAPTEIFFNL